LTTFLPADATQIADPPILRPLRKGLPRRVSPVRRDKPNPAVATASLPGEETGIDGDATTAPKLRRPRQNR
jgi:hypothetical protein